MTELKRHCDRKVRSRLLLVMWVVILLIILVISQCQQSQPVREFMADKARSIYYLEVKL